MNNTEFETTEYGFGEEPQEKTQVMVVDGQNFIVDLTSGVQSFCSLKAETTFEKALLYKAMNNPDHRISDCINETINVTDIYVEVVQCTNEKTGIKDTCPRIVLIDTNGEGFQCVSLGMFGALKKLIQTYGQPTWSPAIPLKVKQITKGEKKLLTLDINLEELKALEEEEKAVSVSKNKDGSTHVKFGGKK